MSFFNSKIERGKFEAANLNAGKSIGPRLDTSLAIVFTGVSDVEGVSFHAVVGNFPSPRVWGEAQRGGGIGRRFAMGGLVRYGCRGPATTGLALVATTKSTASIARTRSIGRMVLGFILITFFRRLNRSFICFLYTESLSQHFRLKNFCVVSRCLVSVG